MHRGKQYGQVKGPPMYDRATIEQAARALISACPMGTEVVLFGSHARGTAGPHSDIDLMVIEPEVESRIAEAARLARVIRPMRLAADVLVVSRADFDAWRDTPCTVYFEAHHDGKRLA
jgi:uncharacterized protein